MRGIAMAIVGLTLIIAPKLYNIAASIRGEYKPPTKGANTITAIFNLSWLIATVYVIYLGA